MKGKRTAAVWAATALVLVVSLIVPWTVFAKVWTDKDNYDPGDTVTIYGDNSDGAGYVSGETVHVDVVGPNGYTAECEAVVSEGGSWSCQVTLWDSALAAGEYTYTAAGQQVVESGTFTDDNIQVLPIPSDATFSLTYYRYNSGDTCGGPYDYDETGTVTVSDASPAVIGVGANPGQVWLKLVAAETSTGGRVFDYWSGPDSLSYPGYAPIEGDPDWPRAICVTAPGDAGDSSDTYYAHYAGCTPRPTVTTHPSDAYAPVGGNATFTVAGINHDSVLWQESANGGVTWGEVVDGITYDSGLRLELVDVTADMDDFLYRAILTGGCGERTSNSATLFICTPPTVTANPSSTAVPEGDAATFTVAGTGHTSTQWQVDDGGGSGWQDLGGQTSDTLILTGVTAGMDGNQYRAILTNSCDSTESAAATLTVTGCTPPAVTSDPSSTGITYGDDASFTVAGTNYTSVQWQISTGNGFTDIGGANGETLQLSQPTVDMDGNQYHAVLTGDCGEPAVSADAYLSVGKADPTCAISGYTGVYDGDPHGASGSCTGVNNEELAGLNLGAGFTNVSGGTANWTFTDVTGNYNDDSGSVAIAITKADPVCTIDGWTGEYDGNEHGASGSCAGVKGEWLATLDLGDTFTEVGTHEACWTFDDEGPNYNDANGCVDIIITGAGANTPPVADPNGPYQGMVSTDIQFDGSGSYDPDGDDITYAWDFGDGTTGSGETPTHAYAAAGIYDVCLTVNDGSVNSERVCTTGSVVDASAGGYVMGWGWINSPAGAYKPNDSLVGTASFSFLSKYYRGAKKPAGYTEFRFYVGNFHFQSMSQDWLVVNRAGTNAQFKGSGVVNWSLAPNGRPYQFMLWATDTNPRRLWRLWSTTPDKFRIKIWWEDGDTDHVVYDNGVQQEIAGGSIVVCRGF